jgi:hypothetical protein
MMRIELGDYERMRAWLAHMVPRVFPPELLTPANNPLVSLDALAAKSATKARSGLSIALADLIELTSRWPDDHVAMVDNALRGEGLATLTELRAKFSKTVQRVVRRGHIEHDSEYHAVRNAAEMLGSEDMSLWPLLAVYEARPAN